MIYTIRAYNAKQVATRFERMGLAAVSAKPAMETISEEIMRIFGQIFESQGRRGGGSWKRDSAEWLLRKQRMNLDPRIGHASLALRRSLTIPGDAHQIKDVTDTSVHVGTDLPYAATEQLHRPFVHFTVYDRMRMRMIVRNHLMRAFTA